MEWSDIRPAPLFFWRLVPCCLLNTKLSVPPEISPAAVVLQANIIVLFTGWPGVQSCVQIEKKKRGAHQAALRTASVKCEEGREVGPEFESLGREIQEQSFIQ